VCSIEFVSSVFNFLLLLFRVCRAKQQCPGSRPAERAQDGRLAQLQVLIKRHSSHPPQNGLARTALILLSSNFRILSSFQILFSLFYLSMALMDRAVVAHDPVAPAIQLLSLIA
jgi:hypothetical protein